MEWHGRALVRGSLIAVCGLFICGSLRAQTASAKYPNYPSETPQKFTPKTDSFNYTRRIVMIPMRDGVKLHTVILIPKSAKHAPILLTRTPYDADELTDHVHSSHLGPTLEGYDNATDVIVEDGYIRVVQDVHGKYHSQGDLHHEPTVARTVESYTGGQFNRYLRHD